MIKLFKGFKYDNGYGYSKSFADKTTQTNYFNTLNYETIEDENYIKIDNSFNVELDFDYMVEEGINYISFNNGYRDIFAFIIKKEYLRKDATRIIYEVDVLQTFMFDFVVGNSFVERKVCEINEIIEFDEGLTLGEHQIVSQVTAFAKGEQYFAMFNGIKDYEVTLTDEGQITHYAELPSSNSKPTTKIDGIEYPLFFMPLTSGHIPVGLVDHPSLVGVVRFPPCSFTTQEIKIPYLQKIIDYFGSGKPNYITVDYLVNMADNITSSSSSGSGGSVPKTEVVDFFPYTYYVLTDGEGQPVIMKPQELPSSITVIGKYALSHQPIERFYVEGYKGDSSGKVYNITNTNQMMLPTASNVASSYLATNGGSLNMRRENQGIENVINAVQTTASAVATGGASLILGGIGKTVSGINQVREADQRMQDMLLTPTSISSFGTPSTRKSFGTNDVRILKYSVSNLVKEKVRNYIARYGNKFLNYATINLKTYKGYIKYIEPNIDSNIDNVYIDKIIEILERGVFFE